MGEGLPFNSERILPIALQTRTTYLSILFSRLRLYLYFLFRFALSYMQSWSRKVPR